MNELYFPANEWIVVHGKIYSYFLFFQIMGKGKNGRHRGCHNKIMQPFLSTDSKKKDYDH